MNRALRSVLVMAFVLGFVPGVAFGIPAVLEMEVVEVNGAPVAPSTSVNVDPGDNLLIELYLSAWTPNAIGGYQFNIGMSSLDSGEGDALTRHLESCTSAGDCSQDGASCVNGFCSCEESLYVDDGRTDYVFFNRVDLPAAACTPSALQFGSLVFGAGVMDTAARKYAGNVFLDVPAGACGTYTLGFDPEQTFTFDQVLEDIPLDESAVITVNVSGECGGGNECLTFASASPPDCEIDARQPHAINDVNVRFGIDTIEITFADANCDTSVLTPGDFNVQQVPFEIINPPPSIVAVTPVDMTTVSIELSGPINVSKWTCIQLTGTGQNTCVGYLPADVNADRVASPADILAVIDSLNGVTPRPVWATDADRSGVSGPEDILRVIDLLNGAAAFEMWLDETLPACP